MTDKYIVHNDRLNSNSGECENPQDFHEWVNTDPYPGYNLVSFQQGNDGAFISVWKIKNDHVQNLRDILNAKKVGIINPEDMTWEDLGFNSPPDGYESIIDYLEREETPDEFNQAQLQLIDEMLDILQVIV